MLNLCFTWETNSSLLCESLAVFDPSIHPNHPYTDCHSLCYVTWPVSISMATRGHCQTISVNVAHNNLFLQMKSIYIYIRFSYSCKRGDKLERIRLDINHNPNLCSEEEIFSLFLSVTFREDVTLVSSDVMQDKYDVSRSSVASPLLFYLPLFPFHTPIHLQSSLLW